MSGVTSVEAKKTDVWCGAHWADALGMAVTVEVKTGERRIIEFFLSPFLKYQDEALREW